VRWLVPSLACLALVAGEPLTATPWNVRKEAGELLDEISRASADPADLLARAQALMLEHGEELITTAPNEAAPITHALTARLAAAGLAERFSAGLAPAAERRASELSARGSDASAWASFARSVPGTAAAARAWRRAADLAWDHGLLRLYHDVAGSAGDREAPGRKERFAAAATLLATPAQSLPTTLDGLDTMWSITVGPAASAPAAPTPAMPGRRRGRIVTNLGRPGATAFGDGAVALADGQTMQVIDHLVGTSLGTGIPLGNRPLPAHIAKPEPIPGGVVAVGLADGRLVLACADAAGSERWRHAGGAEGIDAIGAPLAIDGLVAVPYRVIGEDRLELHVLAIDARDGRLKWDCPVGQLATPGWGGDNVAAPSLARHARGMVVCSNAGLFALIGSDGGVRRLWTYPVRPDIEMDGVRRGRRGLAASDGATAVATPADHAGLVLVLGPEDATPRAYRGDGADGDVLAVHAGDALLAGRQVVLVDTVRLRLRWSAPLRLLAEPQGMLTAGAALVAGNDQLALLSRHDGTMRSGRALGEPAAVAAGDGVLVLAERETIRGFGDAGAFLARLRDAAAAAGSDPRPHTALGAVLAGRGDTIGALAAWRTALGLGAGPAIAERVARLLRIRLARVGDPAESAAALEQLEALVPHLPGIVEELRLWRGLMAENSGDQSAARVHFQAILSSSDRLLPLPDGISVSLRLLAEAGYARTGGQPWVPLAMPPTTPAPMAGIWSQAVHLRGRTVVSGDKVCAFADGLLRAWSLADGTEIWHRKPQRSLLGVQPWSEPAADGVAIRVMPGSAGDAAGLRDGDVLLALNGEALHDFEADLRPRVLALGGGTAFTFRVRGADNSVREVRGRFGGEPLEPLAGDGDIIIARTTMNLDPRRGDLRFFAIDAATGKDLWEHALSHDEERLARTLPVLTGGITVAADGSDLVGIGRDGAVRWRLANRAELLAQAKPIGRCLWLPGNGEAVLLDSSDGRELARLPAAGEEPPVIAASTVAARGPDGRVSLWDVTRGRLLGRSAEPARVLALRDEGLLALDGRGRPVVLDVRNGTVRRVLADAPVEMSAVGASLAYLTLAGAERRALSAIALDGLVPSWSLELPPGLEVEALRPSRDGLLAVLREGTRTWGLSLDSRGTPVAIAGWASDPGGDATPLAGATLVVEARTLRVVGAGLAIPPPPLRCSALDQGRPLRQAAAAGDLRWSQPSGAALAVARHGIHLIIAVRTAGAEHVLRLGDAGGSISLDAVRAMIAPGGLRLAIPGSWTLAEQWTTPDPGGPIVWSAWAPLPSRAPGSPVAVLLDEHAGQPWWLAGGWRNILDPP